MKRAYIQPETDIYPTLLGTVLQDSLSIPKEESEETTTPNYDDWGTNWSHTLWEEE